VCSAAAESNQGLRWSVHTLQWSVPEDHSIRVVAYRASQVWERVRGGDGDGR
jgi:hypothetical protein